jgi:hypothetical protein
MNHPTLEELTGMVHGFRAKEEHVDECTSCHGTAARLADELDLLRLAEARVRPPAPLLPVVWRLAPIAAAAVVLLTIVAAILVKAPWSSPGTTQGRVETPTRELVRAFLDESNDTSAQARRQLLSRGPAVLPDLVEARWRRPDAARIEALGELIFDLKEAAGGENGRGIFQKLRSVLVTVNMQNAPLTAVVDYIREITGLNFFIDSVTEPDSVMTTLKLSKVPLSAVLNTLLGPATLDYDFRHGVIFVGPPHRLWAAPSEAAPAPALPEVQVKEARVALDRLAADSPEERERAASDLRKLGPAVIPALEEGAKNSDAERAGRCRSLIEQLRPRPRIWGSLPTANHWRSQKLQGASRDVAGKLLKMKIDLAFDNTDIPDILSFVRDFSGLNIVGQGRIPKKAVTFKVRNLALADVIELMTLPHGLDVRLEEGVLTIFERMK